MAKKIKDPAKAKAAKQKKIVIGGSVLLLLLMVVEVPAIMKHGKPPAPPAGYDPSKGVTDGAPAPPTAGAPAPLAAPTLAGGNPAAAALLTIAWAVGRSRPWPDDLRSALTSAGPQLPGAGR